MPMVTGFSDDFRLLTIAIALREFDSIRLVGSTCFAKVELEKLVTLGKSAPRRVINVHPDIIFSRNL